MIFAVKVLATSCQKDETQVLVETGPFFGGYSSLEQNGGTTKECKLRGDKSSRQTQYFFHYMVGLSTIRTCRVKLVF